MEESYVCPVCGFDKLLEAPYRGPNKVGSDEICVSCGFQFGYDDTICGETFDSWRTRWIASGMRWRGVSRSPPPDWDPAAQLARIGVGLA